MITEISDNSEMINGNYNCYFCNHYFQLIVKIPIITKITIKMNAYSK